MKTSTFCFKKTPTIQTDPMTIWLVKRYRFITRLLTRPYRLRLRENRGGRHQSFMNLWYDFQILPSSVDMD